MRAFRKLGIATIVCVTLSSTASANNGNGNGNGNSGNGNGALQTVVSLPQITTAPLISRSGNEQMLPASIHKLPSSSIADKPDRGIGVKGQDIGDNGREFERLNKLDRKQTTPTRIDARTGKVEKAEKEAETRLAANTTDDASGVRKTQYQLEPSCR